MEVTYTTPYGTESLYPLILSMQIDILQKRLTPLKEKYAAHASLQEIVQGMLPFVKEELGDDLFREHGMYITTTSTRIFGFGCNTPYKHIFGMNEIKDPLEMWAIGLALLEEIKKRLPELDAMEIWPLYVENAMNAVIGNNRMAVCLRPVAQEK